MKEKKTHQLARALLEIKLNRPLDSGETADHIDENKINDSLENVQVLSLSENASKGNRGASRTLGRIVPFEELQRGDKNGMAKMTNSEVFKYREQYWSGAITKKELYGSIDVNYKSMMNMLKGKTYIDAGGPIGKG